MSIIFTSHRSTFKTPSVRLLRQWLRLILEREKKMEGEIAVVFTGDAYLHEVNRKYLKHDTLTDIITFDNCSDDLVSGDILISVERVRENAVKFNVKFDEELRRVIAHGVLHLCGYKDKIGSDKQTMRRKENAALRSYAVIAPVLRKST
jgi:probable rRNA maturation factor